MNILFPDYFSIPEEEKSAHIDFIQQIRNLSVKTYETEDIDIGMIFIHKQSDIDTLLQNSFEYIPLEIPLRPIELINNEKPLHRLLDNKSLALAINSSFLATGFVRKKTEGKSIHQLIQTKYLKQTASQVCSLVMKNLAEVTRKTLKEIPLSINEEEEKVKLDLENLVVLLEKKSLESIEEALVCLPYIQIGHGSVNWYWNFPFVLNLQNGNWRLKHFGLLMLCIAEYVSMIVPLFKIGKVNQIIPLIDEDIENAERLTSVIKNMSQKNNGGLFIILPFDENKSIDEIPEQLLSKTNKAQKLYKSILKTSDGNMNIKTCDLYLLQSIASIDGAVILDSLFDILSFGEIVNNQLNSNSKSFGARTTAALSASDFGLAIKISEDGDIDIFRNREHCLSI